MIRSPSSAVQIISFGAELIPKGKIELSFEAAMGERIEGVEEMRRIFDLAGEEENEAEAAEGEEEKAKKAEGPMAKESKEAAK
jgi:hypothetical protein